MGWPPGEGGRCKRHPKHRHSNGVCPFCLREKLYQHLSQSSTSSSGAADLSSSTCSSSLYSDDDDGSDEVSSSASSPPRMDDMKQGRASGRLRHSRSLVLAVRSRRRKEEEEEKKKKKKKKKKKGEVKGTKEKFWSKWFGGSSGMKKKHDLDQRSRGDCLLQYSQTFKEKPSAKWI